MGFSLPANSIDLSLVICGSAGQGLASLEILLTRLALLTGYNIFSTQEYMSRIRGGSSSVQIRFSPEKVSAPVERIDLLMPLTKESLLRLRARIGKETLIIGDRSLMTEEIIDACGLYIDIPFIEVAKEIGQNIYLNQVVMGLLSRLLGIDPDIAEQQVSAFFEVKGEKVTALNVKALKHGYSICDGLMDRAGEDCLQLKLESNDAGSNKGELLIGFGEAVGLGAIAGGCDFLAAYPMSPSTGVLSFLAAQAKEFDIIVEQCEDEIAGINMALGAWYAGSRALASTSGGGFALMEEGVSLGAMIESPVVIHIAQRPGPATGLPTRTEQGDLELALYSGHGEFSRIILAPGSISEAFYLTQQAFNLADRFQIPVFILTDQYLMDTRVNTTPFDLAGLQVESHIIETDESYKRYAFTDTGLSPRGIPGFGKGLVMVDSDEHDETG
ncbi:MAG: 2-oxoacid:acceptor oxidoreductase family protein, partial [Proteobacteria bacterium]|nr:2-oxoacid:acceptor oxidoreductase family protein [Pseudomonadota bacterium]